MHAREPLNSNRWTFSSTSIPFHNLSFADQISHQQLEMAPVNLQNCNGNAVHMNQYARYWAAQKAGSEDPVGRETVNRRANIILKIWDYWRLDIFEDNAFNRLFINFSGSKVRWVAIDELCHLAREHHGPQDFQQVFQYFENLLWNKALRENKSWVEILCLTVKDIKETRANIFTAAFWANPGALQPRRPARLLRQHNNAGPPLPLAANTNAAAATGAQAAANINLNTNAPGAAGVQTAANAIRNTNTVGSTNAQTGANIARVVNTGVPSVAAARSAVPAAPSRSILQRLDAIEARDQMRGPRAELRQELRAEVRADLRSDLRADLREEVKAELKVELRAEAMAELKVELRAEAMAELKAEYRIEAMEELRTELSAEAMDELKAELRAQVIFELRAELRQELRADLRVDLRAEIRHELRAELRDQVYNEMREELEPRVLNEVRQQMAIDARAREASLRMPSRSHTNDRGYGRQASFHPRTAEPSTRPTSGQSSGGLGLHPSLSEVQMPSRKRKASTIRYERPEKRLTALAPEGAFDEDEEETGEDLTSPYFR